MYGEPVLWDSWNRTIFEETVAERGIEPEEAEEAMRDPLGDQAEVPEWGGFRTIGRTSRGRWLVVLWIRRPRGRYRLSAREATGMVRDLLERDP